MKFKQINEAQYAGTTMKKNLDNLMKFFEDHGAEQRRRYQYVKENFAVRNSKVSWPDNEIQHIEFAYQDEPEMNDHVLVTYINENQEDLPIKEMVENFVVFETRHVY